MIDAANPDLSAFRRRGGKLILKVNTTDYTVNPRWIMDYYEKVQKTMGARTVDEFVRFYVAIGLFHNRNVGRNPITNALVPIYVDFIAMLDDWVEHGKAPSETQVLSEMDAVPPFTVNATFPMCAYPMYPRYKGTGDPKAAGSYACTASETRVRGLAGSWIEVYEGAAHGWCPPDSGVYNEPQAEKAWSRLLALYGKALA